MGKTWTNAATWDMLAERWQKTIKAEALSENTEWLDEEGHDVEPDEVEAHHIDDFIVDIIEATSPANGAHHYRNLRVYFGWLVKRKQIKAGNPMDETEPPNVPERITDMLSDEDHAARTAAARRAALARFEDQVDPERVLPTDERERRALSARRACCWPTAVRPTDACTSTTPRTTSGSTGRT
jgi:site-specific recombinase XerD